jgi:hypothetical protein
VRVELPPGARHHGRPGGLRPGQGRPLRPQALRKYGRHAGGCGGSRGCTCGLGLTLDADAGPDLLAYLVLLRALAGAVRRCEVAVPEGLWAAAGKVARWEAAHRGLLQFLDVSGR